MGQRISYVTVEYRVCRWNPQEVSWVEEEVLGDVTNLSEAKALDLFAKYLQQHPGVLCLRRVTEVAVKETIVHHWPGKDEEVS